MLQALGAVALASVAGAQGGIADPLDVKVNSASYTVRYQLNNGWALATRGTKLLVLRYTVRNVGTTPREYSRETISIGIRKQDGKRIISMTAPARLLDAPQIELRPNQSITDITWLEVPNEIESPQLTLRSNGVEKPLALPAKIDNQLGAFGKPGTCKSVDEVGANLKNEVKLGPWNMTLSAFTYSERSPSFRIQAPVGMKYCLVQTRFKNPLGTPQALSAFAMNWEAIATDGSIIRWTRALIDEQGEHLETELGGGRTHAGTLPFYIPSSTRLSAIRATDPSSGRSVLFKLN